MSERDRLASLLEEAAMLTELTVETEFKRADYIADYLIAHGVVLGKEKRQKPKTDLDGKCGNCKWAEVVEAYGGYCVRCKNRRKRNVWAPIRQRTCPACKLYERREAEQYPEEHEEAQHDKRQRRAQGVFHGRDERYSRG